LAIEQARQLELDAFCAGLGKFAIEPLWKQPDLLPEEPRSKALPHIWRYSPLRELLLRAGELISAEAAERRVLMLMNPGLDGRAAATNNLYAGLQLVLPGEIAPAHRHAASALRFVIEGSRAYTAVDGERQVMEPGDLVLTPNWAWHDHGNETDLPMIWLDGLDLPIINSLEANFFDHSSSKAQVTTKPDNASTRLYATARLNPAWESWPHSYSPLFNYPWSQTERVLLAVSQDSSGSAYDGIVLEYVNPKTGGAVLPTMACYVQLLSPAQRTDAHRHTSSAVYHVVRGSGTTVVNGQRLEWEEHDTFAIPGWATHQHVNGRAGEPAILFSFSDEPVLQSLGFYREEPVAEAS
jgi:gentisate 1,2-dioxygenase